MITVNLDAGKPYAYKKMVEQAKKDGKLKACGSPDQPWLILKFNTETEFLEWVNQIK